ncbi:hypothetical protein BKA83DRAFT_4237420 [Pisolithus microcarpus]|nr:hypothetical protein BKA83DRAFT_4237420 [Pisolithus microcarpus]
MSALPREPGITCLRQHRSCGKHAAESTSDVSERSLHVDIHRQTSRRTAFPTIPSKPAQFPNDGIRYQDQETRLVIPVSNREMEISETKYGFVPNSQDTTAWRVRRRYRLHRGGHPQLVLVHYARGPAIQIIPSLLTSPVRQYPLRQITEPSVHIMGGKMGQKVYPSGSAPPPPPQAPMAIPPIHGRELTGTMLWRHSRDGENFPHGRDTLRSFAKGKKNNYNVIDCVQPMVKQVEDLQDEYYATKDSSERLALEEDIVGKVLRCGISLGVRLCMKYYITR